MEMRTRSVWYTHKATQMLANHRAKAISGTRAFTTPSFVFTYPVFTSILAACFLQAMFILFDLSFDDVLESVVLSPLLKNDTSQSKNSWRRATQRKPHNEEHKDEND